MRCWPLFACVLLAGCGLGLGKGSGSSGPTGAVAQTAALGNASWLVLDLASGLASPSAALPDLDQSPAYRDRLLALRLVAGTAAVGSAPGAFARQDDEGSATVAQPGAYVAALELTRAQWRRLAGTQPWTAFAAGGADDLPATGMSWNEARAVLAGWGAGRLALPDDQVWEAAARGGAAGSFPWGEDRRAAAAGIHAVTWDSDRTLAGPLAVGRRRPNGFGLFDTAGNVWELTASGAIRGGSWADALALARCANRAAIDPATGHPSVGLRVVYRP